MDIPKARIESALGFDTDHWPDMADLEWAGAVHNYHGTLPA